MYGYAMDSRTRECKQVNSFTLDSGKKTQRKPVNSLSNENISPDRFVYMASGRHVLNEDKNALNTSQTDK